MRVEEFGVAESMTEEACHSAVRNTCPGAELHLTEGMRAAARKTQREQK